MLYIVFGLAASVAHVLSGPDHLAAVTPLAIESREKSWRIGLAWGIGHTLGVLLIGILFTLFKKYIPLDLISAHSEKIVGLILIAIGIWAIVKVWKRTQNESTHEHTHQHHHHIGEKNILAAFSVGILHGLAGVAHLLAILPTLALPSAKDSTLYLTGFGLGTVLAMLSYSFIVGYLAQRSTSSLKNYQCLRIFGGVAAIVVGIVWLNV